MKTEELRIDLEDARTPTVGARYQTPDGSPRDSAILLAHGAGANMDSPFMTHIAEGLVDAGFPVLRFDYPYMQRARDQAKRLPPDRRPVLELAHRAALARLAELEPDRRILLCGKSLGARISSYLAAEDTDMGLTKGLIFLGYPLHPAGKPEKLRSEHFPALAVPALFLQGSRDALCQLPLLEDALETYGGSATLELTAEGDHDFKVPKRTGRTREEVLDDLVARIRDWVDRP